MKSKVLLLILGLTIITSIGASASNAPERIFQGGFGNTETNLNEYYQNGGINQQINVIIAISNNKFYIKSDGGMAIGWHN